MAKSRLKRVQPLHFEEGKLLVHDFHYIYMTIILLKLVCIIVLLLKLVL